MMHGVGYRRFSLAQRMGRWLAIIAMTFQVMFGAAHAAALAAAAFGPLTIGAMPEASFGLLQICTADGLIQIGTEGKNGSKPRNSAEGACPVCSSASASSFTSTPASAIVTAPFVHVVISPPRDICVRTRCISRANPIRGPPLSIAVS